MNEIEFLSELKPDFAGFVFERTAKNFITPELAALLAAKLHPSIRKVGVFANASLREINDTIRITGIDLVQLTGDETPYFVSQLKLEVWKNVTITDSVNRNSFKSYNVPLAVRVNALDIKADLELIRAAAAIGPIILSGGISAENLVEYTAIIEPYAVDVSAGVSNSHGFKDFNRCREFIAAARKA